MKITKPDKLPPRIAIAGRAGCGKTTLALALRRLYGYHVVGFADNLKCVAKAIVGHDLVKPYPANVRKMLQLLGEAMVAYDKMFWVNRAMATIQRLEGPVVIHDLRFRHEFDRLREEGFKTVLLRCSEDHLRYVMGEHYVPPIHISETDLTGYYPRFDLHIQVQHYATAGYDTVEAYADAVAMRVVQALTQ